MKARLVNEDVLETLLHFADIGERYQRAMGDLLRGTSEFPIERPTFATNIRQMLSLIQTDSLSTISDN